MADRAQSVNKPLAFAGTAALLVVALLVFLPLLAVWMRAESGARLSAADYAAIRFTVLQAILSALVSIALGIFAARALARRSFPGRELLITNLGAPFILPVIVAVLGLLAVWGRSGIISQALMAAGFDRLDIYGLGGVVLAHAFFNVPLATRMILQGWERIPPEHFRLAAQLGFAPRDVFRLLEVPMLRGVVPGAFLVIFLLCVSSFAVALTLGGGPRATTIELAIYQAVRFDFDLSKAALLALVQFGLSLGIAALSLRISVPDQMGGGLSRGRIERMGQSTSQKALDFVALGLVAGLLLLPLGAVVVRGFAALNALPQQIWVALGTSIIVAGISVAATIVLTLPLALWIGGIRRGGVARTLEGGVLLALSASPFVLGTGLFLIIHPIADPFAVALPVTGAVNAVMSLPFALRILLPAVIKLRDDHGWLCQSLGLTGWRGFVIVTWPLLRRPLGFAAGLAAALSVGDLGVITLFAPPDVETLPLLKYRLMGAYQMQASAAVALVLLATALGVFWLFDRGGRYGH